MTSIPDNSANNRALKLNGNSAYSNGVPDNEIKEVKTFEPPLNLASLQASYGTAIAVDTNTVVVGNRMYPLNQNDVTVTNGNVGIAYIYERKPKRVKKATKKKTKHKQVFSFTGDVQTFEVPEHVRSLTVTLIGAAGGANTSGTFHGGNGAYVKSNIQVIPGKTYNVIVGEGGSPGSIERAFGGGGALNAAGQGGGGGGRSAFSDPALGDLLTAGGGGGASISGAGGAGGVKADDGSIAMLSGFNAPQNVNMLVARGANKYMRGFNASTESLLLESIGNVHHPKDFLGIAGTGNEDYLVDLYMGENSNPDCGAGGGGLAGGAAGPTGYRIRANANTTTWTENANVLRGSGSGGSSVAEPTLAWPFHETSDKFSTDSIDFNGSFRRHTNELFEFGVSSSSKGGNGYVCVEWEEFVRTTETAIEYEWTETALQGALNEQVANHKYGEAVGVSGEWVAISHFVDGAAPKVGVHQGHGGISMYRRVNGSFVYHSEVFGDKVEGEAFGALISFVDGTMVVSAPYNTTNFEGLASLATAGAIFVYRFNGTIWERVQKITPTLRYSYETFGIKMDFDGKTIVARSVNGTSTIAPNFTNTGRVIVFEDDGTGKFVETAVLISSNRAANVHYGQGVAVNGNTISVESSGDFASELWTKFEGTWIRTARTAEVAGVEDIALYTTLNSSTSGPGTGYNGYGLTYNSRGSVTSSLYHQAGFARENVSTSVKMVDHTGWFDMTFTDTVFEQPTFTIEHNVYITNPSAVNNMGGSGTFMSFVSYKNVWELGTVRGVSETNGGQGVFKITLDAVTHEIPMGYLPLCEWVNLAVVRDGNVFRTYVNGDLRHSYNAVGSIARPAPSRVIRFGSLDANVDRPTVNHLLDGFVCRRSAFYKGSFTPSLVAFSPETSRSRTQFARGFAALLIDENTVLTSMPLGYVSKPHRIEKFDYMTEFFYHHPHTDSGIIETATLYNDRWIKRDKTLIPRGDVIGRINNDYNSFSDRIHIDGDKIVLQMYNSMHKNYYEVDTFSRGSIIAYDLKNDYERTDHYPGRSAFGLANSMNGFQGTTKSDGTYIGMDRVYANIRNLFLDAKYTVTNQNNISEYVQKQIGVNRSGRITEFGYNDGVTIKTNIINTSIVHAPVTVNRAAANSTALRATGATQSHVIVADEMRASFNFDQYNDDQMYHFDVGTFANIHGNTNGWFKTITLDEETGNFNIGAPAKYPYLANSPRFWNFGFKVDINETGDEFFVSEFNSGFQKNSFVDNAGVVHRFKKDPSFNKWFPHETIYSTNPVVNGRFGSDFSYKNGKLYVQEFINKRYYYYELENDKYVNKGSYLLPQNIDYAIGDNISNVHNMSTFMDNGTLIIGNPNFVGNGVANAGNLLTLKYNAATETLVYGEGEFYAGEIVNLNIANHKFGSSLAIVDGNLYATSIGAVGTGKNFSGTLYKFDKRPSNGEWRLASTFIDMGGSNGHNYGHKMKTTGDRLFIQSDNATIGSIVVVDIVDGVLTTGPLYTSTVKIGDFAVSSENDITAGQPLTSRVSGGSVEGSFAEVKFDTSWTRGADQFVPAHSNGSLENGSIDYDSGNLVTKGRNAGDKFGSAVKFTDDGEFMLIGAPGHDAGLNPNVVVNDQGAVFAYYWDTNMNRWRLNTKVYDSTPVVNGRFGAKISVGKSGFLVRSEGATTSRLTEIDVTGSGVAATWTIGNRTNLGVNNSEFGRAFDYNSTHDRYLVGSPAGTSMFAGANIASGYFDEITLGGTQVTLKKSIDGTSNFPSHANFGASVYLDGDRLLVGASGYDRDETGTVTATNRGNGFMFEANPEGYFHPSAKLSIPTGSATHYGTSVGMKGDLAILFARTGDQAVFKRSGKSWIFNNIVPTANKPSLTSTSLTNQQFAFDAVTGDSYKGGVNGTFFVENSQNTMGGVIRTQLNGETYVTDDTGIQRQTVGETGVLEPGHFLQSGTRYFGCTTSFISPDKKMLGVVAPYGSTSFSSLTTFGPSDNARHNGRIIIHTLNPETNKYGYHSNIPLPVFSQTINEDDVTIQYLDGKILLVLKNSLIGMAFLYSRVNDTKWKIEHATTIDSGSESGVLSNGGNSIVVSNSTLAGYPVMNNTGGILYHNIKDGLLSSSRGPHAGADGLLNANTQSAPGGGAGLVGGNTTNVSFSYTLRTPSNNYLNRGAGGGTNLVPAGCSEILSVGAARANPTDEMSYGAGGNDRGISGEDARVVIEYGVDNIQVVFDYTGFDQTFVVPGGVTELRVKLWGAGGGAGGAKSAWASRRTGAGGAGAFVGGTIAVNSGEELKIVVGGGGVGGDVSTAIINRGLLRKYGGGGVAGVTTNSNFDNAGSGGGMAAIARGQSKDEYIVIAGGGGGGGGQTANSATMLDGIPGGYRSEQSDRSDAFSISPGDFVMAPGPVNTRFSGDQFGMSVGILNDNTVLFGAPNHNYSTDGDTIPNNAGTIFKVKRINGRWELIEKVLSVKPTAGRRFGNKMKISNGKIITHGGYAIQYLNQPNASISERRTNIVEVMNLDGEKVSHNAILTMSNNQATTTESAAFIDGKLVVGQPDKFYDGVNSAVTGSGGFAVYGLNNHSFTLETQIVNAGVTHTRFENDKFGSSILMANGYILVGAPGHGYTDNGKSFRSGQGAIFRFQKTKDFYKLINKIVQDPEFTNTGLGTTLEISSNGNRVFSETTQSHVVLDFSLSKNSMSIYGRREIVFEPGTIAKAHTVNSMIALYPTANVGGGSEPVVSGLGRAELVKINNDGVVLDLDHVFTVIGGSNGRNAGDLFGTSVHAETDFVAVGSPVHGFDNNGNIISTNKGAIFVFDRTGDRWQPEIKLTAGPDDTTGFGKSISGKGNWIATSNPTTTHGQVRILQRVAEGVWEARAVVTGSGTAGDSYGASFAMADNANIIVGSPTSAGDAGTPVNGSGSVDAYRRTEAVWAHLGQITTSGITNGRNAGDQFGYSIASNKSYVVVGSPTHEFDDMGADQTEGTGAIWIYTKNPLTLVGKFVSPERTEGDEFGTSVGIDTKSNRIAVTNRAGDSVFVFGFDGENLVLEQKLAHEVEVGETIGESLSFSNGTILVGSKTSSRVLEEDPEVSNAGTVYVWTLDYSTSEWTLAEKISGFVDAEATLMENGRNVNDFFGAAIDVDSRGNMIVGVPGHAWDANGSNNLEDAGAAFVRRVKQ